MRLPAGNDGVKRAAAHDTETASRTGFGDTPSSAEAASATGITRSEVER
jgi:hypothetical protein